MRQQAQERRPLCLRHQLHQRQVTQIESGLAQQGFGAGIYPGDVATAVGDQVRGSALADAKQQQVVAEAGAPLRLQDSLVARVQMAVLLHQLLHVLRIAVQLVAQIVGASVHFTWLRIQDTT